MTLIVKISAAAVSASLIAVLIKKSNPEYSLILGISLSVLILGSALGFMESFKEFSATVGKLTKGSESFLRPVLKCLAVAIITKLSAELCNDAAQSAAASAVDFAGTVCAMGIAMPMIMTVLKLIGNLI